MIFDDNSEIIIIQNRVPLGAVMTFKRMKMGHTLDLLFSRRGFLLVMCLRYNASFDCDTPIAFVILLLELKRVTCVFFITLYELDIMIASVSEDWHSFMYIALHTGLSPPPSSPSNFRLLTVPRRYFCCGFLCCLFWCQYFFCVHVPCV